MSWDIIVMDLPRGARSVSDVPSDFKPAGLGLRLELIERIREVVPSVDFSDPSWGNIDGTDWSIELNMGDQESCGGFTFHVRGGDAAAGVVAAILSHLNLRALDTSTGEFFEAGQVALDGFRKWRAFRDRVIGSQD